MYCVHAEKYLQTISKLALLINSLRLSLFSPLATGHGGAGRVEPGNTGFPLLGGEGVNLDATL